MHHKLTTLAAAIKRNRNRFANDATNTAVRQIETAPVAEEAIEEAEPAVLETEDGASAVRIDDPYGSNTILTLNGTIEIGSIVGLTVAMSDVPRWWKVYLDLSDAEITDPQVMERLEAWIDQLEYQGFRISVCGVSPEHPALRS